VAGPYNLLWLSWNEPHVACDGRRALAKELLEKPDWALHSTAKKVRDLFRNVVRQVAETGCVAMELYAPLRVVSETWLAHVSELEGVNNMVKRILVQAPRTTLVLADAQVGNRKDLGLGTRESYNLKWSQIAGRVEAMLDESLPHASMQLQLRNDIARFAPIVAALPPPPQVIGGVEVSADMMANALEPTYGDSDDVAWARSYNTHWMRTVKQKLGDNDPCSLCLLIKAPGEDDRAWVVTHKYSYFTYMLKFRVSHDGSRLEALSPIECMSSLELFASIRQRHSVTDGVDVVLRSIGDNGEGFKEADCVLCCLTDQPHPAAPRPASARSASAIVGPLLQPVAIMDDLHGGGQDDGEDGAGHIEPGDPEVVQDLENEEAQCNKVAMDKK
jgi:hypothetical protein